MVKQTGPLLWHSIPALEPFDSVAFAILKADKVYRLRHSLFKLWDSDTTRHEAVGPTSVRL